MKFIYKCNKILTKAMKILIKGMKIFKQIKLFTICDGLVSYYVVSMSSSNS